MLIGDYKYEGRGVFQRIIREVLPGEWYNHDCPILETEQDKQDWLDWTMLDKFWEKVW